MLSSLKLYVLSCAEALSKSYIFFPTQSADWPACSFVFQSIQNFTDAFAHATCWTQLYVSGLQLLVSRPISANQLVVHVDSQLERMLGPFLRKMFGLVTYATQLNLVIELFSFGGEDSGAAP